MSNSEFHFFHVDCYEADTDFEGFDMETRFPWADKQKAAGVISGCQKACQRTSECKYFTVKGEKCFLKTSDAGRRVDIGATSGMANCLSYDGYN